MRENCRGNYTFKQLMHKTTKSQVLKVIFDGIHVSPMIIIVNLYMYDIETPLS